VSPSISPSASPSPSPAIYPNRYVLDGTNLPRPKYFRRESIFVAQDVRAISGREGRDKSHRKERFVLGWDVLVSSELSTILTIVEKNQPVTFSVSEENLTINEISVIVNIVSIRYTTPGENYIAETEIELIQVE
jgi:hypothetical protein